MERTATRDPRGVPSLVPGETLCMTRRPSILALCLASCAAACSTHEPPSLELLVNPVEAPAEQSRSLEDYRVFDARELDDGLRARCEANEDVGDQIPSRYAVVQLDLDRIWAPGATIPMSNGVVMDSERRGHLVTKLYDALVELAHVSASSEGLACLPRGSPRLLVVAEARVPLQTVALVSYAAGQAQYSGRDLAVVDATALERVVPRVSGRVPTRRGDATTFLPPQRCQDWVELVHGEAGQLALQLHPADAGLVPAPLSVLFEGPEDLHVRVGEVVRSMNRDERPPLQLALTTGTLGEAIALSTALEGAGARGEVVALGQVLARATSPSPAASPSARSTLSPPSWVAVRALPEMASELSCVDATGSIGHQLSDTHDDCSEKHPDSERCFDEADQQRLKQAGVTGYRAIIDVQPAHPDLHFSQRQREVTACAHLWLEGEDADLTFDVRFACPSTPLPSPVLFRTELSLRDGKADEASFSSCVHKALYSAYLSCPGPSFVTKVTVTNAAAPK